MDVKMMLGTKTTFWKHLGHLGGHLGAPKGGPLISSCELLTETTRWGGEGEG